MMIQYLLDADAKFEIPASRRRPRASIRSPSSRAPLSLEQEKRVSDQIDALARFAREHGDYDSEQFTQWFLKEQIEEVSTMSDLLRVVQRASENPLLAEEFLARESLGGGGEDPASPPIAGGFWSARA